MLASAAAEVGASRGLPLGVLDLGVLPGPAAEAWGTRGLRRGAGVGARQRLPVPLLPALAAPLGSETEPGNHPAWLPLGTDFLAAARLEDEDIVDTRAWTLLLQTLYLVALTDSDQLRDAAIAVAGHAIAWADAIDKDLEVETA